MDERSDCRAANRGERLIFSALAVLGRQRSRRRATEVLRIRSDVAVVRSVA